MAEFREHHCKNNYEDEEECVLWSQEGECQSNPSFMREKCAKACRYCDYESRCQPYKYYQPALNLSNLPQPAMFDKVFDRILSNDFLCKKYNISMISFDPPILSFNNFVPDMTIADLLKNGSFRFERSADAGDLDENFVYEEIISESRTSSNAWCDTECQTKDAAQTILSSMEEVTGIDRLHYEQLQV